MLRLRCRLWGCRLAEMDPVCDRCGVPLNGPDEAGRWFLDRGWLDPLVGWYWRVRQRTWPRCWHCHRLLLFRRRYGFERRFCSEECIDKWLPF